MEPLTFAGDFFPYGLADKIGFIDCSFITDNLIYSFFITFSYDNRHSYHNMIIIVLDISILPLLRI